MAQLFVPPELLEKLRCSVCNLYLSIFPIYIKNDGENPICGRCKIPNENEYLRDEAYEGIAQFLIFPCSHVKNGCADQLTPLKLKDHEYCCTSRKVDCPSKYFSSCNWQGPNLNLKAHFEASHTNLLLTNRKFEVNFINSIKENLLMPFEDELFIVKKEIDSRTGTFTCSVEHVIQNEDSEHYNYFIRMETGDSSYFHKCPERSTTPNSEERTKILADFIRETLHDPPAIVAAIEIIKTGLKEDEPKVNIEVKNPEVDWKLLAELECPVCFDFMQSPIYQCINGHSICSTCKPKVTSCPICKAEIRNTQNFSLGNLTERLTYPCKYHKIGCSVALKSTEIKRHEGSCQYGPYDCPLEEIEQCQVKSNKSEIISHIESDHDAFILKSDKINIPFRGQNTNLEKYYMVKFANRIFKVCFKYKEQKFYWALQLVGPAEECQTFKFEIDIIDNSDKKLRHYARGMCTPVSKNNECFVNKQNYIYIFYDQIADFIDDNLSYRVRVVKD